jgi:hypothetical protein
MPRRLSAKILLAGGLLLAAPGAMAQDGGAAEPAGPISLFPPTVSPGAPQGPAPALPAPGDAPEDPGYSDIEVNRLGELDPESLGILGPEHGGLGSDAWAGSDRSTVEALLRDLSGDLASPTLRRLATRLLLSSAKAPDRKLAEDGAATIADAVAAAQESDFLRLRAERLYALGELAGLNRLLGQVPQRVEDPWLAQARVDGLLLAGRDGDACGQVPAGLARYPQDLYWARAQIFCQFVAGQTDQALLGLDLLREQAPDSDPAFFRLANGFLGAVSDDAGAGASTPLTLAMLRKTGGTLPAAAVAAADPLLLHGIAGLTGGDHAVQAAAVERLVEIGALPGERLAGAYDAFEFTEAELADALAEAERAARSEGGAPRARALLYRAANRESLAAARAEILRAAFLSAEDAGRATAMARAALPVMEALAPAPELAWFAPLAARTLYRAGQFERAGGWLSVLRLDGQRHPESLEAYAALRPLLRLAGGAEPLSAGAGADAAAGDGRRLLLFVLSRALGQEENLVWAAADGDGAQALERLPRLLALGDAAAAGRRGETVLLSLTALGPAAPAESHPLALGYVVSALAVVGLGGDARALAIEAALAAGI